MNEINVMIVEDEPLIAEDIAAVLRKNDYIISSIVYSKDDAIKELKKHLPDIAILDINLNGQMEGIEIAEIIAREFSIPFVFLTSYSDRKTLDSAKFTEPS